MPASSEFDIRGDERQNLERGSIEWSPVTGARIDQTRTDCGIAGCPHIPTGASPEQETGCVAEARAAGRYDIVDVHASNAVTGRLHEWGRPDGRMTLGGCERDPQFPVVASSLGIECSASFDALSWCTGGRSPRASTTTATAPGRVRTCS